MKKILLNKTAICFFVFFVLVGIFVDTFTYNQHKLFVENKDYIVILDARVSNVTEKWNPHADNSDDHEYHIALSYMYNGQYYSDYSWKTLTGDSYDDIHYKRGDIVEIVIFSHTPDKIVSDDPDSIEYYLQKPESILPFSLIPGVLAYVCTTIACWISERRELKKRV